MALDTSSTLTLNGATVVMDGLGFRGGAGLQMSGIPATAPPILPTTTDFVQWAPATYAAAGGTGNGQAGWDAPKGEGIAGTPAWLEESVSGTMEPVSTGTGYPSGSYGQFNLTSVANGNGTTTVYTGTITGGAGNAWAGYTFVVGGFGNAANNGRFTLTASTATTLTLSTPAELRRPERPPQPWMAAWLAARRAMPAAAVLMPTRPRRPRQGTTRTQAAAAAAMAAPAVLAEIPGTRILATVEKAELHFLQPSTAWSWAAAAGQVQETTPMVTIRPPAERPAAESLSFVLTL